VARTRLRLVGLAFTVAFAVLAVVGLTACFPPTRPPFSGLAFTIGFLAGELAGQLLVATAALAVALVCLGWPSGVLGAMCAVVCVVCAASYGVLFVVALRAGGAVARGLDRFDTPRAPVPDAWLRRWRTWFAVPLGHGSVTVHRDLPYVDDGDVAHRLDVYVPRGGAAGAPVLLFVHGGAWVIGSKREQCLPMLYELAARGWVCVACNYRLSPRATWPEHIVDVKQALAWTRAHAAEFGGDPRRFLAIAGASAGGHLAALAALTSDDESLQPGFEDADTSVDACVSLYGVLDMTGDPALAGRQGRELIALLQRSVMKAPIATARTVYEAASPLHRLRADAPPFLVLQGTNDTLVPVEVARAFVRSFTGTCTAPIGYVELPLAQHAFDLLCSPRCTATTRGIATFLEALVPATAAAPPARPESPRAPR
jgi:acetyl esterase/lipase